MLDEHTEDLDPGHGAALSAESLELEKIPRQLWEQVLTPLRPQPRFYVAWRVQDERLREDAIELVQKIEAAHWQRRQDREAARQRGRRTGASLPTPDLAHAAMRPSVQVNVRLRRDDHARLTEAAAVVGLRPTTLARALVLNGVAKIASEHPDLKDGSRGAT